MTKTGIFLLGDWKNAVMVCILSVLSLFVPVLQGAEGADSIESNESRDGGVGKAGAIAEAPEPGFGGKAEFGGGAEKSAPGGVGPAGDGGVRKSAGVGSDAPAAGGGERREEDANVSSEVDDLRREIAQLKMELAKSEAEKSAAVAELEMVRNGLGELLEKLQEKDGALERFQLKFAGMLEYDGQREPGEREVQLLNRLRELAVRGEALTQSLSDFCKQADSLMEVAPPGEVRLAQLLVARDAVLGELRKFSVAAGNAKLDTQVKRTRVYQVARDQGLVILPVGINHGAFNGLMLYGVGKDPVQVRIVCVWPNVSAAAVVSGEISQVTPGMELYADMNKVNK
ncbi:MAG: hypothetical protein VB042_02260 [Victivallaceae bacterium]|nr:hypothetical protein [Victivallaceae bacterium]